MLRFNGLLSSAGLDPEKIRLVRHRHRRECQRRVYQDAIRGNQRFEDYQSGQSNPTVIEQIFTAEAIASFVVDPGGETVFVGLWRMKGKRKGYLADPYMNPPTPPQPTSVVFNLERIESLSNYCGRVIVDWGGGERAWVQYADRRNKEIIEVRRKAEEPHFPGFSRFAWSLNDLEALPATWLETLRASRGVYILIHRESGAQYVGSATGADGFIGRWRGYADGHGGNTAMKELANSPDQYDVRILETVGSGADLDEVYDLESLWKQKLGSRVQGLNRN